MSNAAKMTPREMIRQSKAAVVVAPKLHTEANRQEAESAARLVVIVVLLGVIGVAVWWWRTPDAYSQLADLVMFVLGMLLIGGAITGIEKLWQRRRRTTSPQ